MVILSKIKLATLFINTIENIDLFIVYTQKLKTTNIAIRINL